MNRWLWVFRKETREVFRDKRVRTGAFIMPIFMIVMFAQIFGVIENSVSKPQKGKFAVVGTTQDRTLKRLTEDNSQEVVFVPTREAGIKLMQKGDVKLVLDAGKGLETPDENGQALLTAVYDPTAPLSQISLGKVKDSVDGMNRQSLTLKLVAAGLSPAAGEPIKIQATEAEKPKGLGGSPMASILPYLIVLWAFSGGISIVADLVAGEKEKGTMETLLVSPVKRSEVAIGKFLALALVCFVSSGVSLVGILLLGVLKIGASKSMFPTGVSISGSSVLAMLLAIVPLVFFSSGLLMSVSALAKNMREAQTYLTIVNFAVIMPAVFSQILGFTGMQNAMWVKWTPILGNAVCLQEALLAKTNWPGLMATFTVNCLLAAICLFTCIRLFNRESILART